MSFKQYLKKLNIPGVIFSFGRMNPMHQEHYVLTKDMLSYAKKNKMDAVLYTSSSQNIKKNPLSYQDKLLFLKEMVPKGVKLSEDGSLKNAFQILEDLIKNKGYQRITFMVGEDRVKDFQSLYKYAKQWGEEINKDIYFNIEQRKGSRTKGMSGTDMRNFVRNEDFESFYKIAPESLNKKQTQELYNKVRIGLDLK